MSEEEIKIVDENDEAVVLDEVEDPAPKKKGRKKSSEAKKINGKIDNSAFVEAATGIENDSMVPADKLIEILTSAMTQAYLEWSYPGLFRDRDNADPAKELVKAEIVFEKDFKKFKIFDVKTVVEDDDIIDDAYQISPEDAQQYSKKVIHVGDTIKIPFDLTKLTKKYVRRVKQLFSAKLKDASKSAISSVYSNQIGGLIEGIVTNVDHENKSYTVNFGKAQGTLKKGNLLPSDSFEKGDKVTVYLIDVSDKINPPSLAISRSNEKFIEKLLERNVPEIQKGEIKIKAIAREAGKRTKIFVESENPNIDPVGSCVGPESGRIRAVNSELGSEKIDIIVYKKNKALQIIEAMKPAVVIGMTCPEDFFDENVHYEEIENDRGYEFPKVTCVVTNGTQGVAIGTQGVNVRLASKITKCTISVLTADEAIKENLKNIPVQDIRKLAGEKEPVEEIKENPNDTVDTEEVKEIEAEVDEEIAKTTPVIETPKVAEETKVETAPAVEEVKPAVVETPKVEEVKPAEVETPVVEEKKPEPVKEEEVYEHVEIKNKPKISLEELEQALSTKKGPSETRSRKKWKKDDNQDKKEETPSIASQATAMPIYTDEELEAMEDEEQIDGDDYDDIDLDEYEDDKYYEDK